MIRDMAERPKANRVLDLINLTVEGFEMLWKTFRTSQGTLNFHWKCMMAPLTVLDYIVVHQLAHPRHPNHTAAFWNLVEKVVPDYRERKAWQRVNDTGMGL